MPDEFPASSIDRSRRIFSYFDGDSKVYADPTVVWRSVIESFDSKEGLDDLLLQARSQDTGAYLRAIGEIAAIVRRAFTLPPLDPKSGSGLTDSEVVSIFWDFLAWQEERASSAPIPTLS